MQEQRASSDKSEKYSKSRTVERPLNSQLILLRASLPETLTPALPAMDCIVDTTTPSHAETLFEVEVQQSRNVERQAQDPRVRTRLISDAELKASAEANTVPQAVKSSLKKRTERGGLLGKAGLRDAGSTGMPAGMVALSMATHGAALPVGARS